MNELMMLSEIKYSFCEKEVKELLSSLVVLVDISEQQNIHILKYFDSHKIPYEKKIRLWRLFRLSTNAVRIV